MNISEKLRSCKYFKAQQQQRIKRLNDCIIKRQYGKNKDKNDKIYDTIPVKKPVTLK